jgi:sortase (surface protein transpeptidase)
MRMALILSASVVVAGVVGCGEGKLKSVDPATVTAEMEAEQRQAEKDIQSAEAAMQKQQKKSQRTFDQQVEDEERGRRR